MKLSEAVIRTAELLGNDRDRDKLEQFIKSLDMRARTEIANESVTDTESIGELFIPSPYDMAYVFHAVSCAFFEREEFSLYNNYKARCDELYRAYARLFNRKNKKTAKKAVGLW